MERTDHFYFPTSVSIAKDKKFYIEVNEMLRFFENNMKILSRRFSRDARFRILFSNYNNLANFPSFMINLDEKYGKIKIKIIKELYHSTRREFDMILEKMGIKLRSLVLVKLIKSNYTDLVYLDGEFLYKNSFLDSFYYFYYNIYVRNFITYRTIVEYSAKDKTYYYKSFMISFSKYKAYEQLLIITNNIFNHSYELHYDDILNYLFLLVMYYKGGKNLNLKRRR